MNIVSIGGGDKKPIMQETLNRLDSPNVLIVPSAASTEKSYNRKVAAITAFFHEFGLPSVVLHELGEKPSAGKVAHEFGKANLLYVLGGSTQHMLKTMSEHGTDDAIRQAVTDGTVLSGTSAGAILPFGKIHSNPAKQPGQEVWDFTFLKGLGMVPAALAVHGNQHDAIIGGFRPDSRREHFTEHLAPADYGFAIDENAALVIRGDEVSISRSRPDANVYAVHHNIAVPLADTAHATEFMRQATRSSAA